MRTPLSTNRRDAVFLAGFGLRRKQHVSGIEAETGARESIEELAELARSAGADPVAKMIQLRDEADPATLFGRGKLEELKREAAEYKATMVIVDASLTAGQQRNIEKALDLPIIDRVQLILDIFARHARSREGQLQVELAQLNYMLPRLAGRGTELSRLGGGIGTRGPGEQKLETDRRRIRRRIAHLERSLETVRRERQLRRRARQDVPLATVALVGYTNAGKSTLFNALTRANVTASPRMFATLDPTMRSLRLPSRRRVLLSDTVGFIRDLPPGLVTAFRATLEELQEASLILHVIDISSARQAEQEIQVDKVLTELGLEARPRILIFNKIDRIPQIPSIPSGAPARGVCVSALTGAGIDKLIEAIDRHVLSDPLVQVRLRVPLRDGRRLAAIRANGRVMESEIRDSEVWMAVEMPESAARLLQDNGVGQQGRNAKP
jgi:GTPase